MIDMTVDKYSSVLIDDEYGTLPDQYTPVMFACPVCGDMYGTIEEATECREQPYDDGGLQVGDIVIIPGARSNQGASDDPWLAFAIPGDSRSECHFDRAGYMVSFFVVTAVHVDSRREHRCIVTVASLYGDSLRIGWNPANGDGHHEIFKLNGEQNQKGHNDYWVSRMPDLTKCVVPEQVKEEAAFLASMGLSTRNLL
jgi:hypothetical protein